MNHLTDQYSYNQDDTIAAISTAVGNGGIGIIRLAGPKSIEIALKVFRRVGGDELVSPVPFHLYYGIIIEPENGERIDEVLLSTMRAPHSYTCDDMAEINAHGGPMPLQAILDLVCRHGARLAQAGEFTLRAFLNGRIDLTQAEAVLETISARTQAGLRAAQRHMQGDIAARVSKLRTQIIKLIALLEVDIDYSDEDLLTVDRDALPDQLYRFWQETLALAESHQQGRVLRQGVQVAIVGSPNTGKSSLLNKLLGEVRAIVTAVPGTTRDIIEEQLDIDGILLRIVDTAGIRHTDDEVEGLGVARSWDILQQADLILLLIDSSQQLNITDRELLGHIKGRASIVVLNKSDLPSVFEQSTLTALIDCPLAVISSLTGEGIAELQKLISSMLAGEQVVSELPMLANMRQAHAAADAAEEIGLAMQALEKDAGDEIVIMNLLAAAESLAKITGEAVRDEVIANLFANFCVGK